MAATGQWADFRRVSGLAWLEKRGFTNTLWGSGHGLITGQRVER